MRLGSRAFALALFVSLTALVACSDDDGPALAPVDQEDPGAARQDPLAGPLRVGVAGVGSLDPALANAASPSQSIVADALYDGLTAFDASNHTVVGAVANGWSVDATGTTWTFGLDPTATFSDGTRIVAADVKASLERVAGLGVKSLAGVKLSAIDGYADFLAGVSPDVGGIETPDAATVVVHLVTSFPSFDVLLTDPSFGIVPATTSRDQSDFVDVPVTSGPFRVESRTADALTTVRADGSDAAVSGIAFRLFGDASSAHAAFRLGELDISVLSADEIDAATTEGALVLASPQQVSLFYGMNLASPVLSSPGLRRAIVKAVDSDGIRKAVFGESADTLTGLLGPGVQGNRSNACGGACAYDPDEARAIVATAYPDGDVPTVHVDFFEDDNGREAAIAQSIVEDLVAVGIPAEARPTTFDAYGAVLTSGNAELFRFGWIGAYPSADAYLDPLFGSGASDNVFSVADPELDAVLAAARTEIDDSKRATLAMNAEDRALALDAVVPIVRYRSHMIAAPTVHDVVMAPNGGFDVERVTLTPP